MKKFGVTVLRVLVGLLFMGHGLQKLKGWFGGAGLEGTAAGFESLGIEPHRQQALVAAVTETTAGALLTTGFLTPVASSMVTGVMATAIRRVHAPNGPWVTSGGYEYNAVLMASVFTITAAGPGALSLDRRLGIARGGTRWAFAQLGVGLAGAGAVEAVSRLGAEPGQGAAGTADATSSPARAGTRPATDDAGRPDTVHGTGAAAASENHSTVAADIDLRPTSDPAENGPIIPAP